MRHRAVIGTILAAALGLLIYLPWSLSSYLTHVFILIFYFAYLATCWNILGGFAGQLSFGHALFIGIGAYASTFLFSILGVSPWLGMLAGGGLAAGIGLFIGYLTFRYGLRGVYFALATLAFAEIVKVLVANTQWLGAGRGFYVNIAEPSLSNYQFIGKMGYYYIILALLVLVVLVSYAIRHSKLGYYLLAIRENEESAEALGVNVMRYKLTATALSAFLSALGGTFYAQYVGYIDPPTMLSFTVSVEITIYTIVGGMGTVFGPMLGAFVLVPVAEVVRVKIGSGLVGTHLVVYGAIMAVVIVLAPKGLIGLLPRRR